MARPVKSSVSNAKFAATSSTLGHPTRREGAAISALRRTSFRALGIAPKHVWSQSLMSLGAVLLTRAVRVQIQPGLAGDELKRQSSFMRDVLGTRRFGNKWILVTCCALIVALVFVVGLHNRSCDVHAVHINSADAGMPVPEGSSRSHNGSEITGVRCDESDSRDCGERTMLRWVLERRGQADLARSGRQRPARAPNAE